MAETRKAQSSTATGKPQDFVVQGKPIDDGGTIPVTYRPGPGDPEETVVFGQNVKAGESVDIPARNLEKARGNPYLQVGGEKSYGDPTKEKAQKPDPIEELSFEEEVARERSDEYLEGNTSLPPAPPGENDRVARAMQQAAELKAAVDSEDADKPARGRKAK